MHSYIHVAGIRKTLKSGISTLTMVLEWKCWVVRAQASASFCLKYFPKFLRHSSVGNVPKSLAKYWLATAFIGLPTIHYSWPVRWILNTVSLLLCLLYQGMLHTGHYNEKVLCTRYFIFKMHVIVCTDLWGLNEHTISKTFSTYCYYNRNQYL